MIILGISCFYHDSAACILKDGFVIAAVEEEKLSRIKHDNSFPERAIAYCLREANLRTDEIDYVVFYEKPFSKFERIFQTTLSTVPKSFSFYKESMVRWLGGQLWIKAIISEKLHITERKILFSEHHLSHAASSFFSSPFQKSAILVADAVGEMATTSWGIADGNAITLKEEIHFPHSLGLLYSAFTAFCGFSPNDGENKLMGLAPFGKPVYREKIEKLLSIARDGSFQLDMSYFSYEYSLRNYSTRKFFDLFGSPNLNGEKVVIYYADIAASIQMVLEEVLLKIVDYVYEKTRAENLCFAGGVALNSAANWYIAKNSKFKNIFIQPAAGDSGGALGAALWAHATFSSKRSLYVMNDAYLGPQENEPEIKGFLQREGIRYTKMRENSLIDHVTAMLQKGKVVGWVQGRSEWGPRALGNRSILASPLLSSMKDTVNRKIKFREAFRPFAPSVIEKNATQFFTLSSLQHQSPLKFMLYVVPVKKGVEEKIAPVVHVNGTSRPQIVEEKVNPLYHRLLTTVGEMSGIPMLLNTSFNLRGEPIVNSSRDAYKTFMKSGLDTLVLGNYVIKK